MTKDYRCYHVIDKKTFSRNVNKNLSAMNYK